MEDDPLQSLDLCDFIEQSGFVPIGPASRVGEGLELIAAGACDAAIVDVMLIGEHAGPLVAELKSRGLPFVVVSGYSVLPPEFAGSPYLGKPIDQTALVAMLKRLLDVAART